MAENNNNQASGNNNYQKGGRNNYRRRNNRNRHSNNGGNNENRPNQQPTNKEMHLPRIRKAATTISAGTRTSVTTTARRTSIITTTTATGISSIRKHRSLLLRLKRPSTISIRTSSASRRRSGSRSLISVTSSLIKRGHRFEQRTFHYI